MSTPLHFSVDPRLIELLGAQYRSTEDALKELVANAWDADATEVTISLPEPLTSSPIVVADNGYGMSPSEIERAYLAVAYDRRRHGGSITAKGRKVRGHRGIGKFAGLAAADTMSVTTVCGGAWSRLVVSRSIIESEAEDLERADIALESRTNVLGRGTTVELSGLRQDFAFPSAGRLAKVLLREFGRQDGFAISIDGSPLTPAALAGRRIAAQLPLGQFGTATGDVWFLDDARAVADPGIIVRVDGRAIGEPTFFGLEDDPDIPRSLLQRVAGDIDASQLAEQVQTSWGGFVENALGSRSLTESGREWLKAAILKQRGNEVAGGRDAFIRDLSEQLELVPATRRDQARRSLFRVFERFYEEAPEKRRAIAELVLNAFEHDEYWTVARRIDEAPREDVLRLADVLHDWGLTEAAGVVSRAKVRLKALNAFQRLAAEPRSLEMQMHRALEGNVWIFGDEYELLKSNVTLQSVVRRLTDRVYTGGRGHRRPDLLLVGSMGRYLLVELKRPSHTVVHEDVAQAQKYRDELRAYIANQDERIELAIVGGKVDRVLPRSLAMDQWADSFDGLVVKARARLEWILANLTPEAEAMA